MLKKEQNKSLILELHTQEGVKIGHTVCAKVLAQSFMNFISNDSLLYIISQEHLLDEVEEVFSEKNNFSSLLSQLQNKCLKFEKNPTIYLLLALPNTKLFKRNTKT